MQTTGGSIVGRRTHSAGAIHILREHGALTAPARPAIEVNDAAPSKANDRAIEGTHQPGSLKEASADRRRTFGSNRLPAGAEGIRTDGSTTNLKSAKKAVGRRGLWLVDPDPISREYCSPLVRPAFLTAFLDKAQHFGTPAHSWLLKQLTGRQNHSHQSNR
jgi:hypothetical protein